MLGARETGRCLRVLALVAFCAGFLRASNATSVTVALPEGAVYALSVRWLESAADATTQPHVPFSGLGYVLRQYDEQSQWDWDARTGLLRLAVGQQRFSLTTARPIVAVNEQLLQVSLPIRFGEGEIWVPLDTLGLVASALKDVKLGQPVGSVILGEGGTTATIVHTPEQALRMGFLASGVNLAAGERATSAVGPILSQPPARSSWKVIFDPCLLRIEKGAESGSLALGTALVQIVERCAAILAEEGTMQPFVLPGHDANTSADVILDRLMRRPADICVFLRAEIVPFRASPACTIFFADSSVDGSSLEPTLAASSTTAPLRCDQSYLPFQSDSRQLAEQVASAFGQVSGFRDRVVLPAPLYLLKRCTARSIMINLAFPEGSPSVENLAESGFRESLARTLADALIRFGSEHVPADGLSSTVEAKQP